jgi:hypothetical protein
MSEDDLIQIGTSVEGKEIIEFLVKEKRWFKEQYTVLKFAISVAIKENLEINNNVKLTTSHNVNSLDKDGLLQGLILELFPTEAPYKKAQYLADAGLRFMSQKIKTDEWDLKNFIE